MSELLQSFIHAEVSCILVDVWLKSTSYFTTPNNSNLFLSLT